MGSSILFFAITATHSQGVCANKSALGFQYGRTENAANLTAILQRWRGVIRLLRERALLGYWAYPAQAKVHSIHDLNGIERTFFESCFVDFQIASPGFFRLVLGDTDSTAGYGTHNLCSIIACQLPPVVFLPPQHRRTPGLSHNINPQTALIEQLILRLPRPFVLGFQHRPYCSLAFCNIINPSHKSL